eukprot:403348822
MSLLSQDSFQDQNLNPNILTNKSLDDSHQHLDRKYQIHDNLMDETIRSSNDLQQNQFYGIGYGQNEEIFQSPGFITNNKQQFMGGMIHGANLSPDSPNQMERQYLGQQIDDSQDYDQNKQQMLSQGHRIELVKGSRKSSSNQWTLRNGELANTNIGGPGGDHYDYLNGETLISHNRNPTNMRSQGNYASRPNSNLAVATQLANGTVSAGGFDHDIECEETDFKYLEEVILKVKEGSDQQFHLSDYLQAILQEFQMEQTEEWDAIISEAKEMQKTLKKVLDISFFLLERTQVSVNESKSLNVLNSNLLKEIQIAKDHNENMNVDLRNSKNKIRQQYDAIKTQEDNIRILNDQIQQQLDLIKRMEKSSIISNTQSFGYANMTPGMLNAEQQDIINQHIRKINELETYLAEQTSSYHSEVYKSEKLMNKVKEYQHNEELLNMQIFQLERFKEEKDAKIFKLKDFKKRLQEELIRKDIEIKNILKTRTPANINIQHGRVQMNIDQRLSLGDRTNDLDQSYNTNLQENTSMLKHQRKGFNLCGSQQKWSQELEFAVNKLRESKTGFMQRSFIMNQNIQSIQKAHHKRMQTITSNENLRASYSNFNEEQSKIQYSPFKSNKLNKTIAPRNGVNSSTSQNQIFNDSDTVIKKIDSNGSPEYNKSFKRSTNKKFLHSEESKFDMNDHISPRKSTIYSNFDEDDEIDSQEQEDDVVELNKIRNNGKNKILHGREKSQQSNMIGINESDLMEFNTSQNHLAATLLDQSNFDHSRRLDESSRSLKHLNVGNHRNSNTQQKQKAGSSATTKDTKDNIPKQESLDSKNAKVVTVNNYNITQNIDINNFMSEAQQDLISFKGSEIQDSQSSNLKPREMRQSKFNESLKSKNGNTLGSKNSINQKQIFELQSFGMQQQFKSPKRSQSQMEELKLDFYQQQLNGLKIGAHLEDRSSIKGYNDIHCITIDGADLDGAQRNYMISQLEQENQLQKSMIVRDCTNSNIKIEDLSNRLSSQDDALIEYFMISVLAFILKHPKRTSLQTIDKLNLYKEVVKSKVPFFKWNKWIEKRMIEIYQDRKRMKKAQLRNTFFDPKSWFGLVKKNSSRNQSQIEVIENHFQTV